MYVKYFTYICSMEKTIDKRIYKNMNLLYKEIFDELQDNLDTIHIINKSFVRKYKGDLHNDVSIIIVPHDTYCQLRIYLKNKLQYINHTMVIRNKKIITTTFKKISYE